MNPSLGQDLASKGVTSQQYGISAVLSFPFDWSDLYSPQRKSFGIVIFARSEDFLQYWRYSSKSELEVPTTCFIIELVSARFCEDSCGIYGGRSDWSTISFLRIAPRSFHGPRYLYWDYINNSISSPKFVTFAASKKTIDFLDPSLHRILVPSEIGRCLDQLQHNRREKQFIEISLKSLVYLSLNFPLPAIVVYYNNVNNAARVTDTWPVDPLPPPARITLRPCSSHSLNVSCYTIERSSPALATSIFDHLIPPISFASLADIGTTASPALETVAWTWIADRPGY